MVQVLTTGNQLRAARALIDMDQSTLAEKAGVNINTIGAMEKRGTRLLASSLETIRAVMTVLEQSGVEFLNHGQPGVRLRPPPLQPKPSGAATDAVGRMEEAIKQDARKPRHKD